MAKKYIDAEKLIAQIERLKIGARIQGFNSDYVYALDEVLSFIPFIQQETLLLVFGEPSASVQ